MWWLFRTAACLVTREGWVGLSGFTACKDVVVDNLVKRDAQPVESGSKPYSSPHPADYHRSFRTPSEEDERESEDSSTEGLEMGLQSAINPED